MERKLTAEAAEGSAEMAVATAAAAAASDTRIVEGATVDGQSLTPPD